MHIHRCAHTPFVLTDWKQRDREDNLPSLAPRSAPKFHAELHAPSVQVPWADPGSPWGLAHGHLLHMGLSHTPRTMHGPAVPLEGSFSLLLTQLLLQSLTRSQLPWGWGAETLRFPSTSLPLVLDFNLRWKCAPFQEAGGTSIGPNFDVGGDLSLWIKSLNEKVLYLHCPRGSHQPRVVTKALKGGESKFNVPASKIRPAPKA